MRNRASWPLVLPCRSAIIEVTSTMEFSGRLSAFPIGDILQWAHNDQRTGALVVRRSGREKRVYFANGEVVSCYSSDAAEFFGQHLLVHGLIDEMVLVRALTQSHKQGKRLGVVLDWIGALAPERMLDALRRQIQDLVCDVFLWQHGVFYFSAEMPPREELLPEPLSSVALAMEGARWRDEYARIRRVFVHDNVVLGPGAQFPGVKLQPIEARIVKAMRDQIALGELYQLVRGSHFRFLEAALGLAVREILDVKEVGDDPSAASRELHLADLLIEQAAEEQVLHFRGHLGFPLDLIERCYPAWLRPLPKDEESRLADRARHLYRQIDGNTPLADLLDAGEGERARQVELIALQMRQGNLALLPVPLAALESTSDQAKPETRWWRRLLRPEAKS